MRFCKNNARFKMAELIWMVAIFLYTTIVFIKNSLLSTTIVISNAQLHKLAVLGVVLLLASEILEFKLDKSYLFKSVVIGVLLGVLFLISFRWSGTSTLQKYYAQVFCYIFVARNIEWKHTSLVVGLELLLLLMVVFLLTNSGRLPNFVFIQSGGTRVRQSLGFSYCLQFTACLLNAVLLILSARGRKIHIISLAILMVGSILVYEMTDARIGFAGICIAIVITLVYKFFPMIERKMRWLFWILTISPFVYLLLSVIVTKLYNPDVAWMVAINGKLESRLSLSQEGLINFGVSLFGQNVNWQGSGADFNGYTAINIGTYNWIDNVYIKELIDHGIVYVMIYLFLLTIALICCARKGQYLNILLMALLYGIGLIDDNLRIYCYNSMILMIGTEFMKEDCTKINVNFLQKAQ